MRFLTRECALVLGAVVTLTAAQSVQIPLLSSKGPAKWSHVNAERPLHGRFIHITDLHPDQYYHPGSSINDACHQDGSGRLGDGQKLASDKGSTGQRLAQRVYSRLRHKKGRGRTRSVGYWGAPVSVCDSPKPLIVSTLDWLADHWTWNSSSSKEDNDGRGVDFILWSGDTARHDIDFTRPRKADEIFEYNQWALDLLEERFPGVPIVPNLGNNDIIPHNIMFPGPNSMTKSYAKIWQNHIPTEQVDTFAEGGYYAKVVVPHDLAVLSLNTLYWYDANAATRGCKGRNDPGSIQLKWLQSKLDEYRNASMQAHIVGHVPPTAGNYFPNCYDGYTELVLRYQDTIVGQHFGHMNLDAWFLQESYADSLEKEASTESGSQTAQQGSGTDPSSLSLHASSFSSDLRKDYDTVPTKQKSDLDDYLAFFVAPSVVPTYLPTVRVWTYNITFPRLRYSAEVQKWQSTQGQLQSPDELLLDWERDDAETDINLGDIGTTNSSSVLHPLQRRHRRPRHGRRKHQKRSKQPRYTSPDSPSRRNRYLTLLGYSQWVLDLKRINRAHRRGSKERPSYRLEYATYQTKALWASHLNRGEGGEISPVPKDLLEAELRRYRVDADLSGTLNTIRSRLESTTLKVWSYLMPTVAQDHPFRIPKRVRHLSNYGLPSMTIDHLLEWARELAGNDSLWQSFVRRIFAESGFEE